MNLIEERQPIKENKTVLSIFSRELRDIACQLKAINVNYSDLKNEVKEMKDELKKHHDQLLAISLIGKFVSSYGFKICGILFVLAGIYYELKKFIPHI